MKKTIDRLALVFLAVMVGVTLAMVVGLVEWYAFLTASVVWLLIWFILLYGIKLVKDEEAD